MNFYAHTNSNMPPHAAITMYDEGISSKVNITESDHLNISQPL